MFPTTIKCKTFVLCNSSFNISALGSTLKSIARPAYYFSACKVLYVCRSFKFLSRDEFFVLTYFFWKALVFLLYFHSGEVFFYSLVVGSASIVRKGYPFSFFFNFKTSTEKV